MLPFYSQHVDQNSTNDTDAGTPDLIKEYVSNLKKDERISDLTPRYDSDSEDEDLKINKNEKIPDLIPRYDSDSNDKDSDDKEDPTPKYIEYNPSSLVIDHAITTLPKDTILHCGHSYTNGS